MSKRHEMRKAELERAHHAEMGEHAEAAMAEARAEVLRAELVKEQTDRLGFPLPTDALEANIAELEAKAATLRSRDEELTKQIIEAHVAGREGDPGIARERRAVRDEVLDLAETLTVLRRRLEEGKSAHSVHVVTDWLDKIAASEARVARARVGEHKRQITALEEKLADLRLAAAADYLRANFFSDAAQAVEQTFPGLEVPTIERPSSIGTEWQWEAGRSPLQRLLKADDLAGAVRAIPGLLDTEDPAQVPGLADAIEDLLRVRPPKSPDRINAERRDAVDRPHKAELTRVDAWLKEQLATGPLPVTTLEERAQAASIPIRAPGPDALGWGQAHLGAARQRVGAGPFVKYNGKDERELAAAAQFEENVIYWALGRRVPGLMPQPEYVRSSGMISGMRA